MPPLTPAQALTRAITMTAASMLAAFIIFLVAVSPLQHLAAQQRLEDQFRLELAEGTAPVSEGNVDGMLLADGHPVAILSIPQAGIDEVIVEGTSSGVLVGGPGHRRDTVLPGQAGVSVLYGRATAYGGPFSGITRLSPGDTFTARTGQGVTEFEVIGLRYAGDPTPPAPVRGESRLILVTARGAPFAPTGLVYVDARALDEAKPAGMRQTVPLTLPARDQPLGTDTSTVWALVFALQALVVAEALAVWSYRRFGSRRTWLVFVPVLTLIVLIVADQIVRLLPNLL